MPAKQCSRCLGRLSSPLLHKSYLQSSSTAAQERSHLCCNLLVCSQVRIEDAKFAVAEACSAQVWSSLTLRSLLLPLLHGPLPADEMRAEGVKIAVAGARSAQVLVKEAALGADPEPLRQHQQPTPACGWNSTAMCTL